MANLITSFRFLLLFLAVALAYQASPVMQLAAAPVLVLVFLLDGVDGYVARWRGEVSLFGSVFDIAVDRIVENVLWIILVDLDLVPVWVAIVVITRGFLVDYVRSYGVRRGHAPFDIMRSPAGRFLVGGRFMRISYAAVKMTAFSWILLIHPWPQLYPRLWERSADMLQTVSDILVYLAVSLCVLRGLPVIAEFLWNGSERIKSGAEGRP